MGHDLESVLPVQRDRRPVVLLHGEDNITGLCERALEQTPGHSFTTGCVSNAESSDVEEPLIAANEDVTDHLLVNLNNPPLSTVELVLKHPLGHRVREQRFLEGEESGYIKSACSPEHASEDTRETLQ